MAKFTPIYDSFSSYDVAYFNKQTDLLLKSVMMIDLATEPYFIARNIRWLGIKDYHINRFWQNHFTENFSDAER